MELVVPRFADNVVEGWLVSGLFPYLAAVTGAAFGASGGRWATLIGSGLALGVAYQQASAGVGAYETGVRRLGGFCAPGDRLTVTSRNLDQQLIA